jgi:hypothetical protein
VPNGVRSIEVPAGAFVPTAMRPNTIVLTKLMRLRAVDVEKIPNSGPRTPAVPGTTVVGAK